MTPTTIPDKDWFIKNPDRMYRIRGRIKSDPRSGGVWFLQAQSEYVVVKRPRGGDFSITPAPSELDSQTTPDRLAGWDYDSVLSAYVTGLGPSIIACRKMHFVFAASVKTLVLNLFKQLGVSK